MATLKEMLEERSKIVTKIETLEEEEKTLRKELLLVDEAVLAQFDAQGMSSTKIPGLGNFIASERMYASILPEMKEHAMAVLKEKYPTLVQETVNGNTLSAFWREFKKSGTEPPAALVPCIKESVQRIITWRRGV